MLFKFLPRDNRPLAWAQISHQKVRLLVAVGGIAFANILIFMQLGFLSLFRNGATIVPESLNGDLFLLDDSAEYLGSPGFDLKQLYQAAAVDGVSATMPLYICDGNWAYGEYSSFGARLFAFNPTQEVFNIPEVNQQRAHLQRPRSILFDRRSNSSFGPVPDSMGQGSVTALLNNQKAEVVGLFSLGNSFFLGAGNVIMSDASYRRWFGNSAAAQVHVGIITLATDSDLGSVKAGIAASVPGVAVFTQEELIAKELAYHETNPTGPIFTFGAVMGFVVGVVIVYQVLYADINDHLNEYATLKAIGYSNIALLNVVVQEALLLGIIGFVPGYGISLGMYWFLVYLTELELVMRSSITTSVFALTMLMCLFSATIASRKLRSADPADVF
ncbi:hypothetical protein N836_35275 [Leptolyngbya sp. Heron Island J]|uniref:ABC transporter permease DevC n=1 Tax=Leptolyngbya sp. Heron Island J TaxID=1385935 RepID=UPI0003B99F38|nr:ABC transporter permease DevC [Leptolyngbya sp. Heron Island J]ESA37778.1 hypothetical protein N836_35275 [Leptolyngbya sp. Heron Island J]